jgi:hypothetical protein
MSTPNTEIQIIQRTEKFVAAKTHLPYGKERTSEVYMLAQLNADTAVDNESARFYRSPLLARTAFLDLQAGVPFDKLGNSFNGRSKGEMIAFLDKNHVG